MFDDFYHLSTILRPTANARRSRHANGLWNLVAILSLFRNSVHVLGRIDIGSWKKTELESKLQEIHTAQLKEQRLQLDLH